MNISIQQNETKEGTVYIVILCMFSIKENESKYVKDKEK